MKAHVFSSRHEPFGNFRILGRDAFIVVRANIRKCRHRHILAVDFKAVGPTLAIGIEPENFDRPALPHGKH